MAPVGPRQPAERGVMSRIQGKTFTDTHQVYAGIDVCKATLDLHVLDPGGDGASRRFANTDAGIRSLVIRLGRCLGGRPCRAALEPTGRFHLALWRALDAAGLEVVLLNPFRVRRFAEVLGYLAKPVPGPIGEPTPSAPGSWPRRRRVWIPRPPRRLRRSASGSRSCMGCAAGSPVP